MNFLEIKNSRFKQKIVKNKRKQRSKK